MLVPWKHFIPVDGLLNNLTAAIDWARKHDDLVRQMSLAGIEFAENVLTKAGMMYYTEKLTRAYAQRLHEDHVPQAPRTNFTLWLPGSVPA